MILDANLKFSDDQAVTATADATNIIDQAMALRDAGTGKPLYVMVVVTTALTNTGTVTVALQSDSTTTMTPDKTRDLFVIPAASAVGSVFFQALSPGGEVEQLQYLGLKYTVSGTVSTGKVKAFLTQDVQRWVAKANNYAIS
jgi:hypothetical protein